MCGVPLLASATGRLDSSRLLLCTGSAPVPASASVHSHVRAQHRSPTQSYSSAERKFSFKAKVSCMGRQKVSTCGTVAMSMTQGR